ncbi:MAG: molybdopterin molybdotransferase MoeA, partial [Lachnospiraceae bacterium]|nr:molybdopterin molybdotransferase MoeA [Lachnospiraceae bacterium]
ITTEIGQITDTETVSLREAAGRILARACRSDMDNPPFDRSPLDGYAFRSGDVAGASQESPVKLKITEVLWAGSWYSGPVGQGQAVRIMTGAPIPPGADCVIRQEEVVREEGGSESVLIPHPMKVFENYCFQGEDVKKGTEILEQGAFLGGLEQGILASVGINQVQAYRKPRIAFYVAGDELCQAGDELGAGKIYDANYWILSGRLRDLGCEPCVSRMMGDDPEAVAREIRDVIDRVDLVITTGGVSVGDKDIFHQVLPILGARRVFWRVRMKPGTPAMFAMFRGKPMIHLSGNPFAASATLELLVRPALCKLTGNENLAPRRESAVLAAPFEKAGGRGDLRGCREGGVVTLPPMEKHASGMLFSMRGCNCLAEIPPSKVPMEAGQAVDVIML